MKKKWMSVLTVLVMGTLLFAACKKQEEVAPTNKGEQADDASARNELDRAQEDIEKVYNSSDYTGSARASAVNLPCGSVVINAKNFTITYNGVNCGSRVLGGSIAVTLVSGTKFSDVNAKLKIVFDNYKVHYNSSGEEIVYNGTTYTTNSSGGKLADLFTGAATVIHKTRGTLTLTYDTTGTGGSTFSRTWNLFRKKTFKSTGAATGLSFKFEGDTTVSGYLPGTYNTVSEYGTDVENRKFIHDITTPFLWSDCGSDGNGGTIFTLKTGRVEHTAFSTDEAYKFQFTATAGYRQDGANNILDQTCAAKGYLINWSATVVATDNKFVNYSAFQLY
ncbi:MAG: hypothetical protein H7282_03425 [Cytophagaceae bacterium]|nr:hypothetical protein [Cytophagaceae bacterium]